MASNKQLPVDIVAVESGGLGYLFYVNADNHLAYLKEIADEDKTDQEFEVKIITNSMGKPINVNPKVKQIAAIAWNYGDKREIRVYYSSEENKQLCEYCMTDDDPKTWREGALTTGNKNAVADGSSISATLSRDSKNNPVGMRVYASKTGDLNRFDLPTIVVYKYRFGINPLNNKPYKWSQGDIISSEIQYF